MLSPLMKEIRHTPLLWLLVFVPVVFAGEKLAPDAHTLLFVLSVLAIVPLAALLSHATESVAAKTGDSVGGLLNATLGNLTELANALTAFHRAIHAGEGLRRRHNCHQYLVHAGHIHFSSVGCNTTCRSTTEPPPALRLGYCFWLRSHSWCLPQSGRQILQPRGSRRT